MIYPIKVHKQAQQSGKVMKDDILRFGVMLAVVLTVALFFLINWVVKMYIGGGLAISILITLVIAAMVGSVLLRYFVLDENSRVMEYQNQGTASFARYVNLRKDIVNTIHARGEDLNCFEFSDGSSVCVLQFRYGSNDDAKAKITHKLFERMFSILGEENIPFRTINMLEDFDDSAECDNMVGHCNNIKDKKLAKHLLSVAGNVLDETRKSGKVVTLYLMICPRANYPLSELEAVLGNLLGAIAAQPTAFRSVECLDQQQLLKFYKAFYQLEAIDLSAMRVMDLAEDTHEKFEDVVSLYRVQPLSGRALVNKEIMNNKFHTKAR